jgi:hypothetical protein
LNDPPTPVGGIPGVFAQSEVEGVAGVFAQSLTRWVCGGSL